MTEEREHLRNLQPERLLTVQSGLNRRSDCFRIECSGNPEFKLARQIQIMTYNESTAELFVVNGSVVLWASDVLRGDDFFAEFTL